MLLASLTTTKILQVQLSHLNYTMSHLTRKFEDLTTTLEVELGKGMRAFRNREIAQALLLTCPLFSRSCPLLPLKAVLFFPQVVRFVPRKNFFSEVSLAEKICCARTFQLGNGLLILYSATQRAATTTGFCSPEYTRSASRAFQKTAIIMLNNMDLSSYKVILISFDMRLIKIQPTKS